MIKLTFPCRVNVYIAKRNGYSRRQADGFVSSGMVTINGRPAVLGDQVNAGDKVLLDAGVEKLMRDKSVYLAYHKPVGIVSHSPQPGQEAIADLMNSRQKLFPIGRLDRESHGLIILTNDGRITDTLLNPERGHEKEYIVKTQQRLTDKFLKQMSEGVDIKDYRTKHCTVEKIDGRTFRIILTEGKKRQIRRMCEALGYYVSDLMRIRIMHIVLGSLAPGQSRDLTAKELKRLFKK